MYQEHELKTHAIVLYYQYENLDGNPFKCSHCIRNTETTNSICKRNFHAQISNETSKSKRKINICK